MNTLFFAMDKAVACISSRVILASSFSLSSTGILADCKFSTLSTASPDSVACVPSNLTKCSLAILTSSLHYVLTVPSVALNLVISFCMDCWWNDAQIFLEHLPSFWIHLFCSVSNIHLVFLSKNSFGSPSAVSTLFCSGGDCGALSKASWATTRFSCSSTLVLLALLALSFVYVRVILLLW